MIQPQDIRRKAENLYRAFLHAWLSGNESFFPRVIPAHKQPNADLSNAIQSVRALRDGSKECLGYGYTVEWREVNSRRFGRNRFPARITFETQDDYLRLIRRSQQFERFAAVVTEIRTRYPMLDRWIRANVAALADIESELPGLLEVLDVLSAHPRPGCFARELPLSVDTKFIERHEITLRQWLDCVLPPHTIRADEDHFARRYGLRYSEPHLFVRFLDAAVQQEIGFPCDVVSVPLDTIAAWPVKEATVFIVENKVNLLTVPRRERTIGLGALGWAVSLLRYIPWLSHTPIIYWGDVDVEGLMILSELRAIFPQTRSLLMDGEAFVAWHHLAVRGTSSAPAVPINLTDGERNAFVTCSQGNLRIEQERIPQNAVLQAMMGST